MKTSDGTLQCNEQDQHTTEVYSRSRQGDPLALPQASKDSIEDGVGDYTEGTGPHQHTSLAKRAERSCTDKTQRHRCQAKHKTDQCRCCLISILGRKCSALKEHLHNGVRQ